MSPGYVIELFIIRILCWLFLPLPAPYLYPMKIAEIIDYLESVAPPSLQEEYDNAGLITGSPEWLCTSAIVCLDATEAVIMEAVAKNCNLVIAHHPIVFNGLKKINGKNYVEQAIITAIKHDIAIYAIHTNLDNVQYGVNGRMADQLGLVGQRPLLPKNRLLQKLQVFVPVAYADRVRAAMFQAGAGEIGRYSECSFNTPGTGTFKAGEGTQPFAGEIGRQQQEPEIKLETIVPEWLKSAVLKAMKAAHPYEEVAYDLLPLNNQLPSVGAGLTGELPAPMSEAAFLQAVKSAFNLTVIRHTRLLDRQVKTVAICGGAGSFLISNAIAAGADVFVTADMKYHEFFDANNRLVIADIGHFESEQFTIPLLTDLLQEKFPTFAALKTAVSTNPVQYFM